MWHKTGHLPVAHWQRSWPVLHIVQASIVAKEKCSIKKKSNLFLIMHHMSPLGCLDSRLVFQTHFSHKKNSCQRWQPTIVKLTEIKTNQYPWRKYKIVKDNVSLFRMLATFGIIVWSILEQNLYPVTVLFIAIFLLYQRSYDLLSASLQTL